MVYIESGVDNSGHLWANDGNITLHSDVAGAGDATISGAATLEFGAASSADTTFADGGDGTLILDHSSSFTGAVSGFNHGDSLDLQALLDTNFNSGSNIDDFETFENLLKRGKSSYRRKPVSSLFKTFWTPAPVPDSDPGFAGVTVRVNFQRSHFVKLTKEGSNITVQVDTNGTAGGAEGADWVDVAILDNSASSTDQLTILIDDTDHQFTV